MDIVGFYCNMCLIILHGQYMQLAAFNPFKLESKLSTCLWHHWATFDSFQFQSLSLSGFHMHVSMHLFTIIWYHQQLNNLLLWYNLYVYIYISYGTISMYIQYLYLILFRSQTYHMSLSKILWLHRLHFTMGKLTQRRAVGDDPGWELNANIKVQRLWKIHEIIMKPSSIKPFSIIVYQQSYHQTNHQLNLQTNHQTIQQKEPVVKKKKILATHPGIRGLVTYVSMATLLTGFDLFNSHAPRPFQLG